MKAGAHVKGVLYWYKKSFTHEDWPHLSERIERLICFDITTEEFDMIMVPAEIDGVQGGGQYATSIAEKGGNLCLVNVTTGILLEVVELNWSDIVIPYVPSLVTLFHRPQQLQHTK
ncbi:hypothetical protein CQW23_27024 [Capsicum baccatum]|uniref:Uncharacterized protein n=1 Tax=Capsicum baccatum TaxID=33114 RepID=A0A2G2VQG9_CAPBA|nr:hypothetical protein CQW23_27024 [Capsicum baccatum]